MNARDERVTQDIRKIEELSKSIGGRIRIKQKFGNPLSQIILELDYPTAPSRSYPSSKQKLTEVKIELLSRYPFQEPAATITTPILHPNVYASGKICLGTKWLPTQGLDLLVKRIIQIVIFDPTILNEKSPANEEALSWYRSAVIKYPEAFPTDKLVVREDQRKKMSWTNVAVGNDSTVIISCPGCRKSLRVPKSKTLNIKCPNCEHRFQTKT